MTAYIIKSSLSLLLLFGLYWFLLRKEKLFVFNRFFLVASVVFSLIVPFINIPANVQESQNLGKIIATIEYSISYINPAQEVIIQNINSKPSLVEVKSSGIDTSAILMIVYISGVILFLLRFLKNIYFIFHQIKLSEKISFNGHSLVLTNDKDNPYCFFNYIFINKKDYKNLKIDDQLLSHELEHVKQYHSVDIVFIELIKIFYWFNPVYLLYDRAIRINHEYLADHRVIQNEHDIKSYSERLLSFIFCRSTIPLTSGSKHSFIKKRLLMMTKSRSKGIYYGFRITVALCMILVFFFLLSFKQSNKDPVPSGLLSLQSQTVKDIDGNVYPTISIGTHIWMGENLKTTRYNDGTNIKLVTDDKQWQKYEPAFCWYNNDEAANKNTYGALYNWYTVNTGKLCPVGWHVPDRKEIWAFIIQGQRDTIMGGKLKETGTVHWKAPNKEATNKTGFTAVPGGLRVYGGEFIFQGEQASWWTSGQWDQYIGFGWQVSYNDGLVNPRIDSKRIGYSVRCVKDYSSDSNQDGVSQVLLKEYQDILDKYKRTLKDGKEGYFLNIIEEDKNRLEKIFFQMNKEQQAKQMFVFVPRSSIVLTKTVPTLEQLESFKDPKMYGVWIDGTEVNNKDLYKYKNTDFAYMSASILLKNAINYGKYVYQVDMLTNDGYQNYYNKTILEKGYVLIAQGMVTK